MTILWLKVDGQWTIHRRPEAHRTHKFRFRWQAEAVGKRLLTEGLVERYEVKGGKKR